VKTWNWLNKLLLLALAGTTAMCFLIQERDVREPNYVFVPETQMSESPAFSSFERNPNFSDKRTLRPPPAGTVIRGQLPLHYEATPQDAVRAGRELHNPFSDRDETRLQRGETVYSNYCQVCHGPIGEGNGPVTLFGSPVPASLQADRAVQMRDGQMFHVLTYGQGRMPAFAGQLSGEDRWSVVLHVRMLQKPYGPGPGLSRSEQVAKLFKENCAACHGEDGTGRVIRPVLPLIPDFTSLAWQMSQTEMAIVNQIDYGSNPLMPAFRYKLSADQILRLAVYVRSFASHAPAGQVAAASAETSNVTATNLYGTFCFACHDTTGKGNAVMKLSMPEIPDFTAAAWQKSRTQADLTQSILNGKGKFMLPMKDKLGTVDVKQMVALVRGFQGGKQVIKLEPPKLPGPPAPAVVKAPTISPTSPLLKAPIADTSRPDQPLVAPPGETAARIRIGASIFQQYCIVCHGPDGTGSIMRASMPPIPNFTSTAFHNERSDPQLRVSILDGKGTLMPANRGRVTEEQAADLVAYVRAFAPGFTPAVSSTSDSDFEKQFRQLQDQWTALEKELQKMEPGK
jgi:mono/diheme cytochrome c family protein